MDYRRRPKKVVIPVDKIFIEETTPSLEYPPAAYNPYKCDSSGSKSVTSSEDYTSPPSSPVSDEYRNFDSPAASRPISLVAKQPARLLKTNPLYAEIIEAASKFKNRREAPPSPSDKKHNTVGQGSLLSKQEYKEMHTIPKISTSGGYNSQYLKSEQPNKSPSEKQRTHSFVVNSSSTWNKTSSPIDLKHTLIVKPKKDQPISDNDSRHKYTNGNFDTQNGIPSAEILMQTSVPSIDAQGYLIPDWKRLLMAKKMRAELFEKKQNKHN